MRKILFVLAVFVFTVAVPVYAAVNVSGTWVLTQMSPMGGEESWDVVITQDGENLNVSATNTEFQMMLSGTGTLKGSKIKFSLKGPDDPFEFIFEGKVTGKKMEGTREIQMDQDDRGGEWMSGTMVFESPSSDGGVNGNAALDSPPGDGEGNPTVVEFESLNSNTWSAVMK